MTIELGATDTALISPDAAFISCSASKKDRFTMNIMDFPRILVSRVKVTDAFAVAGMLAACIIFFISHWMPVALD